MLPEEFNDSLIYHERQAAMDYFFRQKEAAGHYLPALKDDYLQRLSAPSLRKEPSSLLPPYFPLPSYTPSTSSPSSNRNRKIE